MINTFFFRYEILYFTCARSPSSVLKDIESLTISALSFHAVKQATPSMLCLHVIIKKCKTFSVLIYSYINTSGNWKNEKLCGNTTPAGRSVFTQFRVFPIFTSVDITVYQYGKKFYISFII